MKSLKLNHELAQLVKKGLKTTTFRLFDDKDLSVGDVVRLVDKVDPKKPESWEEVGTALISSVTEKSLGKLTPQDYAGHETYSSEDEMLRTFRSFYGNNVTLETPVKIVSFVYSPQNQMDKSVVSDATVYKNMVLYADGGSRGNPGPSAAGIVLLDSGGKQVASSGVYLGVTTNNQAEYQSLKLGLLEAKRFKAQELQVYMDSQLVVKQLQGVYKVRNRDLWPIYESVKDIITTFKKVTITHVPRELNKLADKAVNDILDAVIKQNKG